MIKIPSPSLVLNSPAVSPYKMDHTLIVPKTWDSIKMIGFILDKVEGSKEEYLESVVINCHGSPAELDIGSGIHKNNVGRFGMLRFINNKGIWPAVSTFYIVACACVDENAKGQNFIRKMSMTSGAYVIGSSALQRPNEVVPKGAVDKFEKPVYKYGPNGNWTGWAPPPSRVLRR